METEVTLTVPPILAVVILTAIPVVCFALWCEYFKASIEERRTKDDEFDQSLELRRVRWTTLFALLVQVFVHLSIAPIRVFAPLSSLLLFFGALLVQSRISLQAERSLRLPSSTERDHFQVIIRAMLWTMGSLFFYFGLLWGSLLSAHALLSRLSISREAAVWSLAAVGVAAIFAATGLLIGLAPLHLRKMLPSTKIEDPDLRTREHLSQVQRGEPDEKPGCREDRGNADCS